MYREYAHPHPDASYIMRTYRKYMVEQKLKWMAGGKGSGCLRGLVKYRALVEEYLAAKRKVLKERNEQPKASESLTGNE